MEAFSDGVIAILITIMVLEFKVPHEPTFAALCALSPKFLAYVLSFVFLGIYWNNHHHMLQAVHKVNGAILWANLHLLFWLSLIPFTTGWMGESHWKSVPVACYGLVLLASGSAYFLLSFLLVRYHGPDSVLARAVGTPIKETISVVAYSTAVGLAFAAPWVSGMLYATVAAMWLIPDRRIERALANSV
jgi:uncharacterized membrane protein